MNTYSLEWKSFPIKLKKMEEYLRSNLPALDGIIANVNNFTIISKIDFYPSDIELINNYYSSLTEQTENAVTLEETSKMIESIIQDAIEFGLKLIVQFSTENVLLGITQRNMTNHVRQVTFQVVNALSTGSLKDAITEARLIPDSSKDPIFVNNSRLLAFINKVEDHLGMPRSTQL